MTDMTTLPGQERYIAPLDETPLQDVDKLEVSQVDKSKETILTTVGANEEL